MCDLGVSQTSLPAACASAMGPAGPGRNGLSLSATSHRLMEDDTGQSLHNHGDVTPENIPVRQSCEACARAEMRNAIREP